MRLLNLIENSCRRFSNESSKRIIMYLFTAMAFLMLTTEALVNIGLIYVSYLQGDVNYTHIMIFDSVIYASVFGLIGTLAGINGFGKQNNIKKDEPSGDLQ